MQWRNVSDASLWDATFGQPLPHTRHAVAQKTASDEVKLQILSSRREVIEQDVVFVEQEVLNEQLMWQLYCVCDGHAGVEAAEHIKTHLWSSLKTKLPDRKPSRLIGFAAWAGEIRQAVIQAFANLDNEFSNKFGDVCNAGMLTLSGIQTEHECREYINSGIVVWLVFDRG